MSNNIDSAKELADKLEQIDGLKSAMVDDWNRAETEFSMFAEPEEDANLHSVSQNVRNTLENSNLNIRYFDTPSQTRQNWYDFEMTTY